MSRNDAAPDLSCVTTDELWTELKGRFNACLFAYVKDDKTDNAKAVYDVMWKGGAAGIVAAYGLVDIAARAVDAEVEKMEELRDET